MPASPTRFEARLETSRFLNSFVMDDLPFDELIAMGIRDADEHPEQYAVPQHLRR